MGRKLGTLLGVASLAAVAPTTAAAARYASPSGNSLAPCTQAAPCDIQTGVNGATTGDSVYIIGNQGDYALGGAPISVPSTKILHLIGIDGTPRLIASAAGPTLDMSTAPGSSATNLYLENDGSGDGLSVGSPGGPTTAIDRVFVKTTGSTTSHTCLLVGSVTLTNSVCWQANSTGAALGIFGEFDNTLRNDTAWVAGSGDAIQVGAFYGDGSLTVVNTIARTAGGTDVGAFATSFNATLSVSFSNFGNAVAQGNTANDHINTDAATDQTAAPQLVSPTTGDFHELAASPTINAGITNPVNGTLDLDGNPRTVNNKTDIGAYEKGTPGTPPPPPPPPPPPTPPHGTTITKIKIKKHKHSAKFTFKAPGTVTGFQCALVKLKSARKPKFKFTSCSSPRLYKHLKHGKYIFEVRAVNSAGVDPSPAIKKFRI